MMKQHGEVGGDTEEEEESADNGGFTGAPVPGGGNQGARSHDQNPFGEDLPALPGALGSHLLSFAAFGHGLTRRAQIETEIIK